MTAIIIIVIARLEDSDRANAPNRFWPRKILLVICVDVLCLQNLRVVFTSGSGAICREPQQLRMAFLQCGYSSAPHFSAAAPKRHL